MNRDTATLIFAALFCAAPLLAQEPAAASAPRPAARAARAAQTGPRAVGDYSSDVVVVRDAQEQALDQAREAQERMEDARALAALETAVKEMERSLAMLEEAKKSPEKLPSALAAEQAAYQALLKLAAREYRVSRSRNGQQGGQQGERAMRQLDQLDLKQAENRYETERQASPPQNARQHEQLQVLSRLKELAQRQQDLNERIKELQTALQEARTEAEREDIRRRLRRLREEEREMLADVDELRQRMDRPENQSRMAEAREQLDKTRAEVQRAAEALDNNSVPQALTSGTRAQRDLQQLSDDFRRKSSGQFADEMRQMRNDARQLAQKQEELAKKLDEMADATRKTLSDSDERKELADQLAGQKSGATNLINEMRRVSEQSETAEPLLSKQLYDTLRQNNQDEMNKSLDLSAELVQRGFLSQAGQFDQRARKSIDDLKHGVEKAAESVLGDDVEALRLARRELETLSEQLEKEMARAGTNSVSTNALASAGESTRSRYGSGPPGQTNGQSAPTGGDPQNPAKDRSPSRDPSGQDGQARNSPSQSPSPVAENQSGNSGRSLAQSDSSHDGSGPVSGNASNAPDNRSGQRNGAGGNGRRNFFDQDGETDGGGEGGGFTGGPLTGSQFVDWSDRLRDVEEMIDAPELRSEVARIRDRARAVRIEYKQHGRKPDWAVVRLQIAGPLVEVRDRVSEELARHESNEAIVPIDRDPVPQKFSELVRRYYEQLGKSE